MTKMKTFLLLSFGLLSTQMVKSQIKFGIKGGLNLTTQSISGTNVISLVKSKPDFNAGVLANVNIYKSFLLQPEFVFSGQGSGVQNSSSKLDYGYFNIPLLLKYQHAMGIFVETGPQFGILLSAKYKTDSTTTDQKDVVTKSTDFAWVFGLGYKIPKVNLGLDLRYNLGLTNIENSSVVTVKNKVFQMGVFYIF
jgi:Outer membrane protein beta-barrel domain